MVMQIAGFEDSSPWLLEIGVIAFEAYLFELIDLLELIAKGGEMALSGEMVFADMSVCSSVCMSSFLERSLY